MTTTATQTIEPNARVHALLRTYPETRPVFERFGIHTCCGGDVSLAVAAERDGVDLDVLLAALREALAAGAAGACTATAEVCATGAAAPAPAGDTAAAGAAAATGARAVAGIPEPAGPAPAVQRLDVTPVEPKDRLEAILGAYDALGPGQALELVVDHDPVCVYYTLRAEREPEVDFEYLESGPERWRVRVTRPPR